MIREDNRGIFFSIGSALLCIAALFTWHTIATGRPSAGAALFAILLVSTNYLCGILVLGLAGGRGPALPHGFPVALITGGCVAGIISFLIKLLLPIPTVMILPLLFVICVLVIGRSLRRGSIPAYLFCSRPLDLLAVVLSLISASTYSRLMLTPFHVEGETMVFAPWRDYFIHAAQAAIFAGPSSAAGIGMSEMAGYQLTLYHYASYLIPASYSAFTGMDTLTAVTAIWAPYGLFLLSMASYALVKSWWGPAAGIGAIVAASLIPDASHYGLSSSWFSYYWIQTNSASLVYGLSCAAVALLFVVNGCRASQVRPLILGMCLGVGTLFFKAHIFIAAFPLLLLFFLLFFKRLRGGLRFVLGLSLCIGAFIALQVMSHISQAPFISFDGSALKEYIGIISSMTYNERYRWLFQSITPETSFYFDLVLGAFILTFATFGLFIAAYFILFLLNLLRRRLESLDVLPLLMLAIYLSFALLLARNTKGNPFELHHRPFVWWYFLLAAWVGGRVVWLASEKFDRGSSGGLFRNLLGLLLCVLVLLVSLPVSSQINAPGWAADHYNTRVARGHFEAARYIRASSLYGEVVQDSENDPYSITLALTERRAYLARVPSMKRKASRRPVVRERETRLHRLREASTLAEINNVAGEAGIRWYLLHPHTSVNWPRDFRAAPLFESSGFRVFRFGPGNIRDSKAMSSTLRRSILSPTLRRIIS